MLVFATSFAGPGSRADTNRTLLDQDSCKTGRQNLHSSYYSQKSSKYLVSMSSKHKFLEGSDQLLRNRKVGTAEEYKTQARVDGFTARCVTPKHGTNSHYGWANMLTTVVSVSLLSQEFQPL